MEPDDDILTRETSMHTGEQVLTPIDEGPGEAEDPRGGATRPELGQDDPDESDTERQIRELELWEEKQRRQEKLKRLKDRRRRYEEGDVNAILLDIAGSSVAVAPVVRPTAMLPRPDPPEKYEKRDRAQYNRWERDCERYFDQTPQLFALDQQKIDFGERYVAEPLKSLWNAWVRERSAPAAYPRRFDFMGPTEVPFLTSQPTWKEFKGIMLNALGSKMERRHVAHAALNRRRQKQDESPTELLDALRPLWEELQEEMSEGYKVLQYTSALRREIQDDLSRAKDEDKISLVQVEDLANRSWRRLQHHAPSKPPESKKSTSRFHSNTTDEAGDAKNPKKQKKVRKGHLGPNRPDATRKDDASSTPSHIICYNCGEAGHKSNVCTKEKKAEASSKDYHSGKGKGLKG